MNGTDRYNNFMKFYPDDKPNSSSNNDNGNKDKNVKGINENSQRDSVLIDKFLRIYKLIIKDYQTFTPALQLQWCEVLIEVAMNETFISQYTINGEKLPYKLTEQKMLQNQNIIIEHSMKVISKLMRLKYGPSFYLMGCLFSNKYKFPITFLDHDDSKALKYYIMGGKLKHSECCYRCGICYEYGRGTEKNIDQAIEWYKRGSECCGNHNCMFRLGYIYLYELNDVIQCIEWFEMADLNGSFHACFEMGKIYEFDDLPEWLQRRLNKNIKNCRMALKYYYKCATKYNYSLAQWKLGYCYEQGLLGLPVNGLKSVAWYYKSVKSIEMNTTTTTTNSNNNNPMLNIMSILGIIGWYITGIPGILEPNLSQALIWSRRAYMYLQNNTQTAVRKKVEHAYNILSSIQQPMP